MTEQKYRLTVNTLKYEDPWVLDGTLKDIIEQLERVHGDQDDPLEWASEAGVALPYPEDEEYGRLPLYRYWADEPHTYRTIVPDPTPGTVCEFAYQVLNNEMLGIKTWKHLIDIDRLENN